MIRLTNLTATPFILPDGTPLPIDGEVTVAADVTANPAVASWIEAGWIAPETVEGEKPKRAAKVN